MDAYAFAVCCVEILTNGDEPWPSHDDETVRRLALGVFAFVWLSPITHRMSCTEENCRPDIPGNYPWVKELEQIVGSCWQRDSASRSKFSEVVISLEVIGKKYSIALQSSPPDHEKTTHVPTISSDRHPAPFILDPREDPV